MSRRLEGILCGALLVLVVCWTFGPIAWIVLSSLRDPSQIFSYPPVLISGLTLENYSRLWTGFPEFFAALKNSLIVATGATILTLCVSLPAAYIYSRARSRFLSLTAFFILGVRMFPPIVITIPLFPTLYVLELTDTVGLLVVLYSVFSVSLTIWLLKTFIDSVPIELEEAARIDGCSTLGVIARITLPIVMPGIIASAVFVAILAWNEFQFAYLFTSTHARTVPIITREMLGSLTGVEWGALFAGTIVQLFPMLVFVWGIQSYLVKGMTVGSVKG